MVVCGGPIMDRINLKAFSQRWDQMYQRNRRLGDYIMEPPFHMTDFLGRGKYAGLRPELKRAFFIDVAKLVNEHKFYSLSIAVSQAEFNSRLSEEVRRTLLGPYAFVFFVLVSMNGFLSENARTGPFRISYLIDQGFGHYQQLVEAHRVIMRFEEALKEFRQTGALAEDSDSRVPALQAADAVSWASRKMELHGHLPEGFEPLKELLNEDLSAFHSTFRMPPDGIEAIAKPINNWIAGNGSVPQWSDILVRNVGGGFVAKLNT